MVIERTPTEFIIRIPATTDITDVQDFLNFLRYRELTARFSVAQSVVDELVAETKKHWRAKHRKTA
jgi:hypothetical protein